MHDDLISVADQIEVIGPDTFIIAGRSYAGQEGPVGADAAWTWEEGAAHPPAALASTASPESLLRALLYRHCYLRPSGAHRPAADLSAEREFQVALTRSNTGCGTWESGWLAEASNADPHLVVSRNGVRFWVRPDGVQAGPAGFRKGEPCRVRVPKEYRRLQPGYYMMIGDAESSDPHAAEGVTVRLYWHLTSPAAPRLLAAISLLLNGAAIPFRAKVLSSPQAYRRADAGVVYLARDDFPRARGLLQRIHAEVRGGLRDEVPLFTKRLAPGLGVAEDPGNGLSFGQHRCRLLARALWAAHQDGRADARSNRQAIEAVFREERLDPEAPHLSAGSVDTYRLDPRAPTGALDAQPSPHHAPNRGQWHRDADSASPHRGTDGGLVAAAVRIGHALCSQAHWDPAGERCNWIGRSNPRTASPSELAVPRAAALGPDVYGGLSGIALFLAELFACTGEARFQRTALGAVNCALQQLERRRAAGPTAALGFYAGVTGAAFAACHVWARTEEDGASRGLLELLSEALLARDRGGSDDLLSGRASAILALLFLSRQPGWPGCREWAITLGEELCRSEVMVWDRPAAKRHPTGAPPLTGLSHGAAGIGLALLELHAQTGKDTFLTSGRKAFAYEDALFDPAERNWPDLRPSPHPAPGPPARRFAVAWCHGAPGIALSRLRASQLDAARSNYYLAQARAALETTREELGRRRALDAFDATPCHGVTGLIEALWTGGLVLEEPAYRDAAVEAAGELTRIGTAGSRWWSGIVSGGPNPSLMLGDAGVGYHFLRLHDSHAVPPLLIVPTE